uniref:Transmembrane protein n=1 Tax=Medicago truncatula TaxID=3880 RepID=I3SGQ0_MEDTR|nr:unknown [Medicago truncatula]
MRMLPLRTPLSKNLLLPTLMILLLLKPTPLPISSPTIPARILPTALSPANSPFRMMILRS